jgi:hypothetical protein
VQHRGVMCRLRPRLRVRYGDSSVHVTQEKIGDDTQTPGSEKFE